MSAHNPMRNRLHRQFIFIIVIALGLSSLVVIPRIQAQSPVCVQSYTVQPGDNLFRIGLAVGVNYQVLATMNGITNPNLIYVGQVLCLPGPLSSVPTSWLTLTPMWATLAAPTPTPGPYAIDPCFTSQVLTVQVTSEIFFSPDRGSRTGTFLRPGSKFRVCTSNPRTDWTLFILDGIYPLWVPAGVFG